MSAVSAVAAAWGVVADTDPAKVLNDDTVSPGLIGTAVVFALIVGVVFLIRSFLKQLRKISPDLPDADESVDEIRPDAPEGRRP